MIRLHRMAASSRNGKSATGSVDHRLNGANEAAYPSGILDAAGRLFGISPIREEMNSGVL